MNPTLYYSSLRPNNLGIYHFKDGNVSRVTAGNYFDQHPAPSPDGAGVVFSGCENGSHHLFFLQNGERTKLTDHPLFEDHARFDSCGNIYFCSDYGGAVHIFRAKWTGERIQMHMAEQVTEGPGNCFTFCVSPDGQEIVFSSNRDNLGDYEGPQPSDNYQAGRLYRMTIGAPGSCHRLLASEGKHWEGTPEFSADGKYLFFYSNAEGYTRLYRLDCSTKQVEKMADEEAAYPVAMPGDRILFSVRKHKRWKIQSMALDGAERRTIAKIKGHCMAPRPAADGSFYFFGETAAEEGFVLEEGSSLSVPLKVIRGLFPVVDEQGVRSINAMKTVERCPHALYKSDAYVFGLAKGKDGGLLTTEGTPFASTASHIIALQPVRNLTEKFGCSRNAHPCALEDDSIVFSRQEPGQRKQLYRMDENGLERLTEENEDHVFPAAYKHFVVFSSTVDRKSYSLKCLDLRSRHVSKLTEGFVDIHACFSPDGRQLVFTSNRGGMKVERPLCFFFNPQPYGDLFLLDMQTKVVRQLTSSPYEDSTPSWKS